GARGAPETSATRLASTPADNSAAATVSPARTRAARPSIVISTIAPFASGSRRNIEPPRAEHIELLGRQRALRNQWRKHQRVGRREGHAAVAGGDEGAGRA